LSRNKPSRAGALPSAADQHVNARTTRCARNSLPGSLRGSASTMQATGAQSPRPRSLNDEHPASHPGGAFVVCSLCRRSWGGSELSSNPPSAEQGRMRSLCRAPLSHTTDIPTIAAEVVAPPNSHLLTRASAATSVYRIVTSHTLGAGADVSIFQVVLRFRSCSCSFSILARVERIRRSPISRFSCNW
jgi:hypothetical protein